MDAWTDRWTDGWVDGWMHGRMGGWMGMWADLLDVCGGQGSLESTPYYLAGEGRSRERGLPEVCQAPTLMAPPLWLIVWGSGLGTRMGQLASCLWVLAFGGARCLKRVEVPASLAHASLDRVCALLGPLKSACPPGPASLAEDLVLFL